MTDWSDLLKYLIQAGAVDFGSSKDIETVINALIKRAYSLPKELYKLLTWDRSREMADHQRFTLTTDIIDLDCC